MTDLIDTPVLREVLASGAVANLKVNGVPGGFVLIAQFSSLEERILQTQRGQIRRFQTLDAIASYMERIGSRTFQVDLAGWTTRSLF